MNYPDQLKYKEDLVMEYLEDAGFDTSLVQPIIGMADPDHYRHKMEITFGEDGKIGMHEVGKFLNVVDWQDSSIASKIMVEIKEVIASWQKDWRLPAFNKVTKEGLLRNLLVRESKATEEVMVGLFITEDASEYSRASEDLVSRLTKDFPTIKSIVWLKNTDIADATQTQE